MQKNIFFFSLCVPMFGEGGGGGVDLVFQKVDLKAPLLPFWQKLYEVNKGTGNDIKED